MAYDNTNRGSIWPNKKKRPDKQDADFTGSINVNGVEYWLNAWKRKEGASPDSPSLSFTVRPKDAQQGQQEAPISQRAQATIRKPDPISSGRHEIQPPSRDAVRYGVADKAVGFNSDMDDDIPF